MIVAVPTEEEETDHFLLTAGRQEVGTGKDLWTDLPWVIVVCQEMVLQWTRGIEQEVERNLMVARDSAIWHHLTVKALVTGHRSKRDADQEIEGLAVSAISPVVIFNKVTVIGDV